MNSKTYTGQDYKSTIYQRGVNQNSSVNYHTYIGKNEQVNKSGIIGFVNTVNQNYGIQYQMQKMFTHIEKKKKHIQWEVHHQY